MIGAFIHVKEMGETLPKEKGVLYGVKADVSNEKDVSEVFQWIRSKVETIHVLVNCAGIGRYYPLTGEGKADDLQKILGVNTFGMINCTTEALKLMKEKGVDNGHIIHINSVAGHGILPFNGHYVHSASKHGVTSISPGLVNTEMIQDFLTPGMDSLDGKPMLEPKDIADSVVYVLSTPPHVQIHELTIKPVGEEF
ncbi:hypothetical protein J437_LFUL005715 [Ladona fulva]|uniref:Uncharacterized protein n=1 Tax=Ladona fulva TaxID=123851 RepID=A0A8K0NXL3_LADFU|nr:hypothetical protein J437_LFUL005715 [Ladona fulva]